MSEAEDLSRAAREMRAKLEKNCPEAIPDFDMLIALGAEDDPGPWNPSESLRINEVALRAYCEVNELLITLGKSAGIKSSPTMLSFLLGLQLGHRVAYEQVGRTA